MYDDLRAASAPPGHDPGVGCAPCPPDLVVVSCRHGHRTTLAELIARGGHDRVPVPAARRAATR